MLSKYATIFMLLLLLSGTAAYSQQLYKPTAADAQKTGISLDTLILGRKLYVNNCGSCHSLYMPEKYTEKEWAKSISEMEKKAKLNDQQALTIFKYLKSGTEKK